jgi:hypothetical protein
MFRTGLMRRWRVRAAFAVAATLTIGACDSGILEVNDPDIVLTANNAAGARALRNGVFLRLSQAVNGIQGPDALFVFSGLMADEWRSGDTFVQRNNQDQRIFQPDNTFNAGPSRSLNRIRTQAGSTILAFRQFLPDSAAAIGSMFALTAYSEVLVGELYCNGTPLNGIEGTTIIYGDPLTNDSVFHLAANNADSALGLAGFQIARENGVIAQADSGLTPPAGGTRADTIRWAGDTARWRTQRNDGVRRRNEAIRVRSLAAVVKGRALVDLRQFAAAAAAVDTSIVATTFKFHAYHSLTSSTNQVWALNNNARRYTMTNGREGGVGIDFVTPNDPRLPRAIAPSNERVFDTSIPMTLVRQALYGQFDSIPIATGVEARLIQAEAELQPGGNPATWLSIINTLRTDPTLYPPIAAGPEFSNVVRGANLTALADSGARNVDVHFRERAFWMFSTGHRLGDMRRLLRQYGRTEAQVYPNGAYIKGGTYGDATMMPVPFDEQNNPKFNGCLDRNP